MCVYVQFIFVIIFQSDHQMKIVCHQPDVEDFQ